MIEVVVTQVEQIEGRMGSRTAAILRFDENDPAAMPEQLSPIDGKTLAVMIGGLRKIAAEHAKAWAEFGDPTA